MEQRTVMPDQKSIVDLSKFEKLLKAERISIDYSSEQGTKRRYFLADFLREIENDPKAVEYFTRGGGDESKNARALVESMDLTNIKSEVLVGMYLFYTQASAWSANFGAYDNPSTARTRLQTGKRDKVTENILYTQDSVGTSLFKHPATSVSKFDQFLEKYPEEMSVYITAYLENFVAIDKAAKKGESFYGTDISSWNYSSSYEPKQMEFINKTLSGRKPNSVFKLFTTSGQPNWDIELKGTGNKIRR